ncbi:MAG: glycosyltransferase family 4 protein [Thermoplasmata archaeon]|nr:glycosyltransferase family 4 protein [Thermoplasmata archaeon]
MKVLFAIAHVNKGGGQAVQVLQLVRRLAPRVGGELLALHAQGAPVSFEHDSEVKVVGDLRFPSGLGQLRRAIRARKGSYDLLQVFDPYYSLPAARLEGARPLVVRMGAHPVEDIASRYGTRGRVIARILNPWLYAGTTVVVNAAHLRDAFPGRPVVCIPNGVDSDRFHVPANPGRARAELGLPEGVPLIAFTGKIIPRKNVEDLYWLAREIPSLHVLLLGNDQEEYYGDRYHRAIRAAFPEALDRVHAVGEIPMERVPTYLEAADLFVFPSRLEGMPNSILEAWAAGLPVIAADTAAHREIVRGGTGLLFRDRAELQSHVETLLADPSKAREMGLAGRQTVLAHFSLDGAAQRYFDLYEHVIAGTLPAS